MKHFNANLLRFRRVRAFAINPRFLTAALMLVGVVAAGTVGYMLVEGWSFLDALFMTVITVATIGYGETNPLSHAGRIYTIGLILVSLLTIGYAVSTLVAFLVEGEFTRILQGQRMEDLIAKLDNHVILCGAGSTGKYVAEELAKTQTPFVVVDSNPDNAGTLKNLGDVPFVLGDATVDDNLRQAGIERARGLVSVLPEDRDNVFVVLTARALNPKLRIISRLVNEENRDKLRIAGANEVISPNAIGGLRMASVMLRPSAVTFLDQMLRVSGQPMRVDEFQVDDAAHMIGKNLLAVDIEHRTGLLLVALKSAEGSYTFNPHKETVLRQGDVLIVMGPLDRMTALRHLAPT